MSETLTIDIIPENDVARLKALHKYEILHTPAEEAFDHITQIMAQVFKTPMAFVSLVDKEKVFYKSQVGPFGKGQVDREDSLCSLTILGQAPLVFEDASKNPIFQSNPYVDVNGGIRFYAGAPLVNKDGFAIGTVCIVDTAPRTFSEEEKQLLNRFARLTMHEIELRLEAKAISEDVTMQATARLKAEEVQKTLTSALETLPEKGWMANSEGEATYLTKGWYDYTGQTPGEAEGKGWISAIHPDDAVELVTKWQETIKAGAGLNHEARIRSKDGEYRWHMIRSAPIPDPAKKTLLWGGTCSDIHERKMKAEELEKKVRERTVELERSNANLEEFAHAASHDLKEPIRKVNFFADRLHNSLKPSLNEEQSHYFERIQNALHRMASLIDDLLNYSSVSKGEGLEEETDLNEKVKTVLEDLEVEIQEKGARIVVDKLPTIKGNQRQLQQLFQNLLSNALKYSKVDCTPEIYITARNLSVKTTEYHSADGGSTKQHYLIEVRDNGIGFEQKEANRIFKMFQRLHGRTEYKGTGVGLSIVKKVVENHKGYIWAESEPGQGATFKILFPAH